MKKLIVIFLICLLSAGAAFAFPPSPQQPAAEAVTLTDSTSTTSSTVAASATAVKSAYDRKGYRVTGTIAAAGDATNFPAATAGDVYQVTSAGWLGGAENVGEYTVEGDQWVCQTTTVAGTKAEVRQYWNPVRNVISLPDGSRYIEISSNTSAPAITNGIYWLNDVLKKVENSVAYPIHSNVYETVWVPASAMTPTTTNGSAIGTKEFATNDIMVDYLAFDTTTKEYAAFNIVMPEGWDRSTFKAKFFWAPSTDSGAVGDTVEWELAAGALSNGDTIDTAVGTAQVINDAVVTGESASLHISGATPAITSAGTPALGDMLHFKIARNVGNDNHGYDAWLFGVLLQIKLTNTEAAW